MNDSEPAGGPKQIEFRGSALHDLRTFPVSARREAGFQLDQVQHGRDPDHWKPMNTIGQGVREIRIRDENGTFRVIYIAKFSESSTYCTASRKRRRRPIKRICSALPETTLS
jgi:phage-related protein